MIDRKLLLKENFFHLHHDDNTWLISVILSKSCMQLEN